MALIQLISEYYFLEILLYPSYPCQLAIAMSFAMPPR